MLSHRLMRYLDVVARCGSIRKAAAQLNVASSAINRQILALEAELGTALFHRLPRRLQLTAAGEVLVDHVRQTQKGFERTRSIIDAMKGLRRGEVSIAVMSGPSGAILPPILEGFRQDHPHVRLRVRVLSGPAILAAVGQGEADLGLAFDLPREKGLRVVLHHSCALGAVMRPDHPLAGRKELRLADCQGYPLVLADPSMAIRPFLDGLFDRQGLTLDAAIETDSIEVMRRMAMAGPAITFLTAFDILMERQEGKLVHLPLQDRGLAAQQLMLVTRDRASEPLAGLIIERCRAMLVEHGAG